MDIYYYRIDFCHPRAPSITSHIIKETTAPENEMHERFPSIFRKITSYKVSKIQRLTKEEFESIPNVNILMGLENMEKKYDEYKRQRLRERLDAIKNTFRKLFHLS